MSTYCSYNNFVGMVRKTNERKVWLKNKNRRKKKKEKAKKTNERKKNRW